ncbi:MAG TPA: hypothetical protein VES03_01995 [Motilibacterales bacterium]|nr:hypothetical protein [Motilibacterales bacterium]
MATGRDEGDRRLGRLAPVCSPDRGHLERVAAAEVEVEDVREAEEIVGSHLPRLDWTRVSLRECCVRLVDVADLVADRARLIDSHLSEPDITHLSSSDSTWRSVTVEGGRIGAWDLAGGVVDGITVAGAQLGYVNMRDATLTDVALRDCRIETLDLAGAKVRRVSLAGCVIDELVVIRADLDVLDLRGARLDRVDGVENLGGVIISAEQLLDIAPALAAAAGITIGPWPA